MEITREPGGPKSRKSLASGEFIDPRDLGPNSPIRDLARAYLQELRDKGRSELTLPRYERFLSEFLDFVERDGAPPHAGALSVGLDGARHPRPRGALSPRAGALAKERRRMRAST